MEPTGNPFENPPSSSSLSILPGVSSATGSNSRGHTTLTRDKRSFALYLKEESAKENNCKPLNSYLDYILDPQKSINDFENLASCKWIIAGGLTYDEFSRKVREYDSSVMCGLVWTANFVAYRCRTCCISPCMSICSECFQSGNHEGHDYNMFRSQAGGACDCGDASVMRPEGFCPRHGDHQELRESPEPPMELVAVAKEMMPRLFIRLLYYLRKEFVSQAVHSTRPLYSLIPGEMEPFLAFLQSLSDLGASMRRIMAETLTSEESYRKSTDAEQDTSNTYVAANYKAFIEQLNKNCIPYPANFEKYRHLPGMSQKLEYTTIIEELVFWVLHFVFPQSLVTFLLGLLPDDVYKEAFAKAFVMHYSRISAVLTEAGDRTTVANRVVHISVQLFSNRDLAGLLAEKHNLLLTIILSLSNMISNVTVTSHLADGYVLTNIPQVVNCEDEVMKEHCYWPVVSDLINVLSHRKIALQFLQDSTLVTLWLDLLKYMQGMNFNDREMTQHVEFEPDTYYAAFSAELEISASPMWSLLLHCQTPDARSYLLDMVKTIKCALDDWYTAIGFTKVNKYGLTFHLPLHRYLSTFIMTAIKYHDMDLESLLPESDLLQKVMMYVLHIQACLPQVYAGMWARNGIQMKGQAMTYIQCHFCYSMADADLFLLQMCATKLDPDQYVYTVLNGYNLLNWLSYLPEPSIVGIDIDHEHQLAMLEGALSLFSSLFGMLTYLGISETDLMRKEMASLLCMNDRQHSTLMDLMPEKSGVNGFAKEMFEPMLQELAEYKAPTFESGGSLRQGTYVPKTTVWEDHFDPVHVSQRAIYKRDMQSAMDRYAEYLRTHKNYKKTTTPWPPFKICDNVHHAFKNIYRILNCSTLHAFLFTVLHKALTQEKSLPEAVLFHSVHLLNLCVQFAQKTSQAQMVGSPRSVPDDKRHWFSSTDIRVNACEVIDDVVSYTNVTEEDIRKHGSSIDDMDTSLQEAERIPIKESLISVLIKLHTKRRGYPSYKPHNVLEGGATSSNQEITEDDAYCIGKFLDKLCSSSGNASHVIYETCRSLNMIKVKASPSDSEKDTKRRKAWRRQQKLMADFASKQKAFMEQNMGGSGDIGDGQDSARGEESECSAPDSLMYECVICNRSTPSKGSRLIGQVMFLQSSSVLGHRHQNDCEYNLEMSESQAHRYHKAACGKVQNRKLETMLKRFEEKSCSMSVNIGWEGGVVAQTCGHYLHLDCHKAYVSSLRPQNQAEVLDVNKGEYWCPLCRQLSNSVIPIVPEESKTMLVKPVSPDPMQMVLDIAEFMVKRRVGTENESLKRATATVMEDLTHITYLSYRCISTTPRTESVHLFLCSVARINLEVEILLRGGKLCTPQQSCSTLVKKDCFLSLLHALSLHSNFLIPAEVYTDLWSHLTGIRISDTSCSMLLYKKEVPLLLKDPCSLLIQFVLTLSFAIEPGHLDFVIQMLYNMLYIQSLTYLSCKFSNDERDAWRRKGKQSQSMTLDKMLSNIINWLSRTCLFEEIDNALTLPAICQSVWSPQTVEQVVEEFCLPFLRIASLLKSHIFGMEIPTSRDHSEFQQLTVYLKLGQVPYTSEAESSLSTSCVKWVVEEPHVLVRAWCQHLSEFINTACQEAKTLLLQTPNWGRPALIKLPKRYYHIFQKHTSMMCATCSNTPKDPAICLTCGRFLCFKESCCVNESVYETVAHSIQCGAGTGMFLLVNSCSVVVIRGARATLWGSVYLDEHGEEDRDLKRGKPLYLSNSRYSLLETQWLGHTFDHVCKRWIWHKKLL